MILDKGSNAKTERSKNDIWLTPAFLHILGSSVHYHLQCALFVYTREMLVPLTLCDGVQRECLEHVTIRNILASRAIQNILT